MTGPSGIVPTGSAPVQTDHGTFTAHAYTDGKVEHLAMVYGDVAGGDSVPVRIHSECMTGDLFASQRCDCGEQLRAAIAFVVAAGRGVVVYLTGHEGRGIGLGAKLAAYRLQQSEQLDTVDANLAIGAPVDDRDYSVAAAILGDLGVRSVELLTNNPVKTAQLRENGVPVSEVVSIPSSVTPHCGT